MHVTPRSDVELDLAAVPAAIRRAGFTPAELELVARGRFESRDGTTRFRIRGWETLLSVRGVAAPPADEVSLRARVEREDGGLVLVPIPP